jgi:hypothetical protein
VSGDLWGGIYFDWRSDSSEVEYADVGYAETPIFIYDHYGPLRIGESKIHHFKDTRICVSYAQKDDVVLESNEVYREEPGAALDDDHGNEGILLDHCVGARVLSNSVSLEGVYNSAGGSGIRILNDLTLCTASPASPETLMVGGNTILGPGEGGSIGGGFWSGLFGNWACSYGLRKTVIEDNVIEHWNEAGLKFWQSVDVPVSCNVVDSVTVGLDFSRTTAGDAVRLRHNRIQIGQYDGVGVDSVGVVETDDAANLVLGPDSSSAGTGENKLISRGRRQYVFERDPVSTDSLDARECYWMRNGYFHTTPDSIRAHISGTKTDPHRVKVEDAISDEEWEISCLQGGTSARRQRRQAEEIVSGDEGEAEDGVVVVLSTDRAGLETGLSAPRPNPSRRSVRIDFTLAGATAQEVVIEVFDVAGRRVRSLVEERINPGRYRVSWNGRDDSGKGSAAGIYFLRMRTEGYTKVRRIALLR